jgi:hypothetical protein
MKNRQTGQTVQTGWTDRKIVDSEEYRQYSTVLTDRQAEKHGHYFSQTD